MLLKVLRNGPRLCYGMVGDSLCVSSNYNWTPGLGSGHDPIQKAMSLREHCTELEQDLILALSKRHSEEARDADRPLSIEHGK